MRTWRRESSGSGKCARGGGAGCIQSAAMSSRRFPRSKTGLAASLALAAAAQATLANTPISIAPANSSGNVTPRFMGYNMGHYMPGSNTSAWLQYSGANAFRYWAPANDLEPSDDNGYYGD